MTDEEFEAMDHLPKVREKLFAHRGMRGRRGVRLDIPSAARGIQVVAIHESPSGGRVIGYDHSASLRNVNFNVQRAGARQVGAEGGNKFPFAYICGELGSDEPLQEGTMIYYNPRKVHLFVGAATRHAVKSAERVYQVGRITYATGVRYYTSEDMPLPPEGMKSLARGRKLSTHVFG